jgi:hypothetical protein
MAKKLKQKTLNDSKKMQSTTSSVPARPTRPYLNPINKNAFGTTSFERPMSSFEMSSKVDSGVDKRDSIVKTGPLKEAPRSRRIKEILLKGNNKGKPLAN